MGIAMQALFSIMLYGASIMIFGYMMGPVLTADPSKVTLYVFTSMLLVSSLLYFGESNYRRGRSAEVAHYLNARLLALQKADNIKAINSEPTHD